NFFATGGDSIKSIQIVSRLRQEGYDLTVKDIFISPTIRELASQLRKLSQITEQGVVTGVAPLSPIQRVFLESTFTGKHHFNQSALLHFPAGLSVSRAQQLFTHLQEHHDALRMVFVQDGVQENRGTDMSLWLEEHDLRNNASDAVALYDRLQSGIDLASGPLMRIGLYHFNDGSRVLMVIHHLVIDGVSWRILFEDIATL
ncbi:condensation domain-containing protein, partial [Chitinophaga varians]|uniref:condensation domain-containing protein n=1 Tax=Chitinophaga varians TaxID=2202339 RepID=UPI001985FB40